MSENQLALKTVIHEIERGAARLGWDRPPAIYALVPTQELLAAPDLPADIAEQLRESWTGEAEHLSAILQDPLAEDNLEEILPELAWPDQVAGAAVAVERAIIPPEVEDQVPEDPHEAAHFVASHPDHTDVRLTVGVLRSGESWCAIRTRPFDSDDQVGSGENLIPGLVELLRLGFVEAEPTAD
ncbi:PPA1309 family protein [Scrofimicrobium sp. R131]|uniref:PPA1309 family protein n=1 Tax=Scrofimicrobium appendicitidis TaxID=3079930 RepID=A0AAU7V559_9ACTO